MDTVSIFAKEEISLEAIRAQLASSKLLPRTVRVYDQKEPVVVEEGNSRVYINHARPNENPKEKILTELYLDYSSLALVKTVIVIIADNPELTVENEYGTSLPGDKFVAWIKSEPNLIWRGHHSS